METKIRNSNWGRKSVAEEERESGVKNYSHNHVPHLPAGPRLLKMSNS